MCMIEREMQDEVVVIGQKQPDTGSSVKDHHDTQLTILHQSVVGVATAPDGRTPSQHRGSDLHEVV